MISPILAGSVTAVAYAVSTLGSARSSRLAGAVPAVAGVMLVGTILLLPVAVFVTPIPADPPVPASALVWATLAGAANVGGLLLAYAAYRLGTVGIVSTIGSTEGAVAAVISVLAGQALAPGSGPALVLVVIGVVLAATSGGHELEEASAIAGAQSSGRPGSPAPPRSCWGLACSLPAGRAPRCRRRGSWDPGGWWASCWSRSRWCCWAGRESRARRCRSSP